MKKKHTPTKRTKKALPTFRETHNGFIRDGKAVVVVRRRTTAQSSERTVSSAER